MYFENNSLLFVHFGVNITCCKKTITQNFYIGVSLGTNHGKLSFLFFSKDYFFLHLFYFCVIIIMVSYFDRGGYVDLVKEKRIRRFALASLVLYMLCLIWIISLKCNMVAAVADCRYTYESLSLLQRCSALMTGLNFTTKSDVFVNILLFIPLGILVPFITKRHKALTTVIFATIATIGFEIFQIISCYGGFMYMDILCNSLGAMIGAALHFPMRNKLTNRQVEKLLETCVFLFATIVAFASISTAKHIDVYLTDDVLKYTS